MAEEISMPSEAGNGALRAVAGALRDAGKVGLPVAAGRLWVEESGAGAFAKAALPGRTSGSGALATETEAGRTSVWSAVCCAAEAGISLCATDREFADSSDTGESEFAMGGFRGGANRGVPSDALLASAADWRSWAPR